MIDNAQPPRVVFGRGIMTHFPGWHIGTGIIDGKALFMRRNCEKERLEDDCEKERLDTRYGTPRYSIWDEDDSDSRLFLNF